MFLCLQEEGRWDVEEEWVRQDTGLDTVWWKDHEDPVIVTWPKGIPRTEITKI